MPFQRGNEVGSAPNRTLKTSSSCQHRVSTYHQHPAINRREVTNRRQVLEDPVPQRSKQLNVVIEYVHSPGICVITYRRYRLKSGAAWY
jgi:hypothetical protein